MSQQLKNEIISILYTLPVCKPNSTKTQWTVRCPYCGDSKNRHHGHFSILINVFDDTQAMVYRCFKCNESGLFTNKTLEDLGLYDDATYKQLLAFNSKLPKHKHRKSSKQLNYEVPPAPPNAWTKAKLYYINSRLGTDYTEHTCVDNYIILSFKEFMKVNMMTVASLGMKSITVNELEKNYIGFLTLDRNKIIFRDATGKGYFGRYYKLKLDKYFESSSNYYSVGNKVDLMYTGEMNIHLAEGVFDILSIRHNLFNDSTDMLHNIFYASGGFNFRTILEDRILSGITTDIVVHLYADKDKSDDEIMKNLLSTQLKIWVSEVIIYRNMYPGEKDFGVPSDRIDILKYTKYKK